MTTARARVAPTGRESTFGVDEIIVSKTDLQGRITYCNDVFRRISGYGEDELQGSAHSIIRHPEMPRCVFELLWRALRAGREIFAYVNNLAATGDAYWVFAHVTPSRNARGEIVGYHSNRRLPSPEALRKVRPLYDRLLAEERAHADRRAALAASMALLERTLAETGLTYDEWVWSVTPTEE